MIIYKLTTSRQQSKHQTIFLKTYIFTTEGFSSDFL